MRNFFMISPLLFLLVGAFSCSDDNSTALQSNLLGTWELIRYEDRSTNTMVNPPTGTDPIVITFMESKFEGDTGRNTFLGDYTTESKMLVLLEYGTTEIAESEWGGMFADAIVSAYNSDDENYRMPFSIEGNTLKIHYEASKFMQFEKL